MLKIILNLKSSNLIILMCLYLISVSAFANVIDLDCHIKPSGENYIRFLNMTKTNSSATSQTIKAMPIEDFQFSIDTANEKVLFPLNQFSKMIITPTKITFELYNNNEIIGQYSIDRLTGSIDGFRRASDESWSPYFSKGEIMFYFTGICEGVKRKF